MNAEILSIGTELLLGNIVNTNAVYLSNQLAALGIHVYDQSVVGDNADRLKKALDIAFERADLVITTGGLGPTYDDLTKETLAEYFHRPMVLHEPSLERIHQFFNLKQKKMCANNEKQAIMPQDAIIFANDCGTAPGAAIEADGKIAIMLPGPPSEMQMMFEQQVRPYLAQFSREILVSQTVHLFGIGESTTESLLKEMMTSHTNPTIAPYAKNGEVTLRLTAAAATAADGYRMIAPLLRDIDRLLGQYIYGIDVGNLQTALVQALQAKDLTVSTAESCTGGLISKCITDIPGSSRVFAGGVCTYTNASKSAVLQVQAATLDRYSAVSAETALEMAHGVRALMGTDFAVSTTGIAGPDGGTALQPVGLVYVAIVGAHYSHVEQLNISMGQHTTRDMIREYATKVALYQVLQAIG